jgi:DNA invertase Pin-like site-specific DNA recombinase
MHFDGHAHKVAADHLRRRAYLYIRQSSIRQVLENTESTERQYALRQRAIAAGWPAERIVVIDGDQGQTASSSQWRTGFQHLVSEVGLGRAGIVMGLEVSRLARKNSDWHRLLEICALTQTLILDEDGIYDPAHFNDRLLLGLKGAMSEAELYVLHARLQGGALNKARRGELKIPLPTGFVYDALNRVKLDPDKQVQESIGLLFQTFRRTGTAHRTAKVWREQELQFPRRLRSGPHRGEIVWGGITAQRILEILRNPRYAGAFAYGRTQCRQGGDGRTRQVRREREEWIALHPGAHEGYISWDEYEENLKRLAINASSSGGQNRRTAPREGPALLQGIVVCGKCGHSMTVRYHSRKTGLVPEYVCQSQKSKDGSATCQSIPGAGTDEAIARVLLEAVAPVALEVSLAVQQELGARSEEVNRVRRRGVERTKYETQLARQRYMQVDPSNRLVADELEADWNEKLRAQAAAIEDYEQKRSADTLELDEEGRRRILSLCSDFPRVWNNPKTPARERKRMVRLLIEDVTLIKGEEITAQVRYRGGATTTLHIAPERAAWEKRRTPAKVLEEIDRLLDHHTDAEVAAMLNEKGYRSGEGHRFDARRVAKTRRNRGLKSRRSRLREAGLLTLDEIAERLGISKWTVKLHRAAGTLPVRSYRLDDVGRFMYEDPATARVAADQTTTASTQEA